MTPLNRRLPRPVPEDEASDRGPALSADSAIAPRSRPNVTSFSRFVRVAFGAALVLALSTTVAWAARRYILTSPRFAVSDLVVSGNHFRTAEQIATRAGIARGTNIFTLDFEGAEAKLRDDPWIKSATLARRLPGKVFITVTEHEVGAIVALPEAFLADRDGTIWKPLEVGDPFDAPVITGLTVEGVAEDRLGTQRLIVRALGLRADYEQSAVAAGAPLEEIHVSNGGELTLVVGKDAVSLALGLPPFHRKLDQVARILTELKQRGARPSVVMLDDEAKPDRVVVRTKFRATEPR